MLKSGKALNCKIQYKYFIFYLYGAERYSYRLIFHLQLLWPTEKFTKNKWNYRVPLLLCFELNFTNVNEMNGFCCRCFISDYNQKLKSIVYDSSGFKPYECHDKVHELPQSTKWMEWRRKDYTRKSILKPLRLSTYNWIQLHYSSLKRTFFSRQKSQVFSVTKWH